MLKQPIKKYKNYKNNKFYKLLNDYKKLQVENQLLKTIKQPITIQDKIQVLEDYFKFCSRNEYNSSNVEVFIEYKEHLKKRG